MNRETEILKLADYSEKLEYGDCSCILIVNKALEYPCMFGFVNLSENFDNVSGLFALAEKRTAELGYSHLIGPLNFTTWMSYRWALNRYDLRYYPDCDNPPYYVDFIRRLGYRELYTYRSARINLQNRAFRVGKAVTGRLREYKIRRYRSDEAFEAAREVYDLSIDAFEGSYLYSPIPFEVFEKIYLTWVREIEDMVLFIADYGETPVGYALGYVNPYDHSTFIGKTIAVAKEFRKKKAYAALIYQGYHFAEEHGFKDMVYHFECEQRSTFKRFPADLESEEKRYAVFIKELS